MRCTVLLQHPQHLVKRVLDAFNDGLAMYEAAAPETRGVETVLADATLTELKAVFEELDIDHSNKIDVEDMIPILKRFTATGNATMCALDSSETHRPLRTAWVSFPVFCNVRRYGAPDPDHR